MARYVDGFVVPVPTKNLKAYRSMAGKAGKVWREHGSFEYVELGADTLKRGKWTYVPQELAGVDRHAGVSLKVFRGNRNYKTIYVTSHVKSP